MSVRRVASAVADFGLGRHWYQLRRGRQGWDRVPELTRELAGRFTTAVCEAVSEAGHPPAEVEFVAATRYGTAHVAEVMHEQLREAGPKWLDPEQFLHYAPHAPVSAAALAAGIGGAGSTLVGPDAQFQAVAHAVRRVRAGRTAAVVVAAYEALTPFAAAALAGGPGAPSPPDGQVTALVLSAEGSGPVLTPYRSVDDAEVRRLAGGPAEATAEGSLLRALAAVTAPAVLTSGGPGPRDAVVVSP